MFFNFALLSFRFGKDAKVVHFLGAVKPWHHFFDTQTSQVHIKEGNSSTEGAKQFIQMWWEIYSVFQSAQSECPVEEAEVIDILIVDLYIVCCCCCVYSAGHFFRVYIAEIRRELTYTQCTLSMHRFCFGRSH